MANARRELVQRHAEDQNILGSQFKGTEPNMKKKKRIVDNEKSRMQLLRKSVRYYAKAVSNSNFFQPIVSSLINSTSRPAS
jgi:hypothetical protein